MSRNGKGNRSFVIGVGMTKFAKPGTKDGDYPDWAKEAGENTPSSRTPTRWTSS